MKKTAKKIVDFKKQGKKITALTAYDYSTAKCFDRAGVDVILVGDSLAQVALGYNSTCEVSLDEMKIFVGAVARGAKEALIVADMPFLTCQTGIFEAIKNAGEMIKCGAQAVKIEGANDYILDVIKHLTQNGIPVMGHLGFTPQYINSIGGHFVSAKSADLTIEVLKQAKKLQTAGAFSVVLEMVPAQSAKYITQNLEIPTIGIGGGVDCDGQILVSDDALGKYGDFCPKFAKKYANLNEIMFEVAKKYCNEVEKEIFPSKEHSFLLSDDEVVKLENYTH